MAELPRQGARELLSPGVRAWRSPAQREAYLAGVRDGLLAAVDLSFVTPEQWTALSQFMAMAGFMRGIEALIGGAR